MKKLLKSHSFQEGVLFLLVSGWLLYYGFDSQSKAFNKDWTQSPYLFPILVAVLMGALALGLLVQGVRGGQEGKAAPGSAKTVAVVLGLSLLYYVALAVIRMPYTGVTVGGMVLAVSTFELSTVVFLLALLLYLGVRSKPVLIALPLGATVFLSIVFRSMLHVLLP